MLAFVHEAAASEREFAETVMGLPMSAVSKNERPTEDERPSEDAEHLLDGGTHLSASGGSDRAERANGHDDYETEHHTGEGLEKDEMQDKHMKDKEMKDEIMKDEIMKDEIMSFAEKNLNSSFLSIDDPMHFKCIMDPIDFIFSGNTFSCLVIDVFA